MKIGANYKRKGIWEFTVWAPLLKKVDLMTVSPVKKMIPMEKNEEGYWRASVGDLSFELLYLYRLEGDRCRPDPASHSQPKGVHGPSQVVDHDSFHWGDDDWKGIHLSQMILYELHTGTFTPEGTFDAIIPRIDDLIHLGINTIELMPVAQFPGERNWGYDGVYPFAVQNSYGGPLGLKRLMNECHRKGMAVVLDVVYNHLGPEGNYLWDFGPYFTDKYKTPWGSAINFDGAYSDGVRNFFTENALHWFVNYHVDGLRLDAVHGIVDISARPFLQELGERAADCSKKTGRRFFLIAESNLNDPKVIKPKEVGGYGMDALWCDDFHHSIHTLITGEVDGYYMDFGKISHLAESMKEGFVYSGQYSHFRKRKHGNSSRERPASQFVVFSQNHDQIGNRMVGERMSALTSFEGLKLAAGVILLSPYIPLLFMGEEYGEETPFLYFISHSDFNVIEAVREGRKEEFKDFMWKEDPSDPQSVDTFLQSKIHWEKRNKGIHAILLEFYRTLIQMRKEIPALSMLDKEKMTVRRSDEENVLCLRRWNKEDKAEVLCIFNFNTNDVTMKAFPFQWVGKWRKILDSSEDRWHGPGTLLPDSTDRMSSLSLRSQSVAAYQQEEFV
ncbi:MAG: malto-oligosyltrehalose trehalohydrolase [Thermodesulfobacteriota bacterium]|nr:malto-oligosyltrehalose trehalohydrolase [Thermodesulfobacteriota bacterium]